MGWEMHQMVGSESDYPDSVVIHAREGGMRAYMPEDGADTDTSAREAINRMSVALADLQRKHDALKAEYKALKDDCSQSGC